MRLYVYGVDNHLQIAWRLSASLIQQVNSFIKEDERPNNATLGMLERTSATED